MGADLSALVRESAIAAVNRVFSSLQETAGMKLSLHQLLGKYWYHRTSRELRVFSSLQETAGMKLPLHQLLGKYWYYWYLAGAQGLQQSARDSWD